MPENLLGLLTLCLLALLYLFFLRVLWAVWSEVRAPKPAVAASRAGVARPRGRPARRRMRDAAPSALVIAEPAARAGVSFPLGPELHIGRAAACHIALPDDTYVSQTHARVFQRDGMAFVEDLGSTNGTYLNGTLVSAPAPIRRGDRLQVGATVIEVV